jgi:hypothetical protein
MCKLIELSDGVGPITILFEPPNICAYPFIFEECAEKGDERGKEAKEGGRKRKWGAGMQYGKKVSMVRKSDRETKRGGL